ncbi:MAG: hypothetical protein Q9173_001847 [Seirophora scorigena]
MDPLSIAASIIGLCAAAVQINSLLKGFIDSSKSAPTSARHVLTEVTGIYACLHQLEVFLSGRQQSPGSRRSLIMIEQVIIVFTDCVSIFSELEQTLELLRTDGPMRVIDRVKWGLKEKAMFKFVARLQTSKASLNLMLNILTCASLDSAEATTKELTAIIQQVLKSNINMSRRLKRIERMHPAMNPSACPSRATSIQMDDLLQLSNLTESRTMPFEEELETSPAYKGSAFNTLRISQSSSNAASEPSYLSGLSLSDVSNASAMALPISSTELWNHYRYTTKLGPGTTAGGLTLDAWYYPSVKKSAFIRTDYFNGHYTNQYQQARFAGHLIYRRFDVTGPDRSPRFKEGLTLVPKDSRDRPCSDQGIPGEGRVELEDTSLCTLHTGYTADFGTHTAHLPVSEAHQDRFCSTYSSGDAFSSWGRAVLELLESIGSGDEIEVPMQCSRGFGLKRLDF